MIQKAEKVLKDTEWISTSLPQLDKVLGGGIPLKRTTILTGAYSMGKSTIAQLVASKAQKRGMNVLWFDSENSADMNYMKACGMDISSVDLLQPDDAESGLEEIEEYIKSHKNTLVVLDAVTSLVPREEKEKTMGEQTIGLVSRVMARFCRKIGPYLRLTNSALIVISHDRVNIVSGANEVAGGKKLSEHASIILRLRLNSKKVLKAGDKIIGKVIIATVKKNKVSPTENQDTDLHYINGDGFQRNSDLLEEAIEKGIIVKAGASYSMNGEKIAHGQNAMRELLKDESFLETLNATMNG
jgi:recombination protein RecA